jgi:hypothetical protein
MGERMAERWVLCALVSAACACSADSSSGNPRRGPAGTATGPTVGSNAGSAAAAGTGGGLFGNSQQSMPSKPVGDPNGLASNDLCEVVHLTASPSTPDVLIVLDRSGSMEREGRWMPSVAAVRTITNDLQAQINFGLALFPQPVAGGNNGGTVDISACLSAADPQTCLDDLINAVGGTCTPGSIVVPVGPNTAPMIASTLDMTNSAGGTPTGETLENLITSYAPTELDPDALPRPKFVLLVTDGQPTCPNGGGEDTTQPDIDRSNMAIDALLKKGVRTYVIGYNTSGPGNEMLAAVLDGFAQRGGTGDTMHHPVEDEAGLKSAFQMIAGDVVNCTFVLDKPPMRSDYVLVKIDGSQINLDDPNGWHLVGDRTVELTGQSCDKLKSDGAHIVDAEVQCDVVTPI